MYVKAPQRISNLFLKTASWICTPGWIVLVVSGIIGFFLNRRLGAKGKFDSTRQNSHNRAYNVKEKYIYDGGVIWWIIPGRAHTFHSCHRVKKAKKRNLFLWTCFSGCCWHCIYLVCSKPDIIYNSEIMLFIGRLLYKS